VPDMKDKGPGVRKRFGVLAGSSLADVLQMCCLGGATTAIRTSRNGCTGSIYLVAGKVVHAEDGDVAGEAAFYALMGQVHDSVECTAEMAPKKTTMKLQWHDMVPAAVSRRDDGPAKSGGNPSRTIVRAKTGCPTAAPEARRGIRVLIVDDSRMMRKALASELDSDDFIVVGNAANGAEALQMIPVVNPDVITLDVNMPVMDGISALKRIMIHYRIPTIMVSAFTREGAAVTFDALKFGAVDFISKPSSAAVGGKDASLGDIREKVRRASRMAINAARYIRTRINGRQVDAGDPGLAWVISVGTGEGGCGPLLKTVPLLPPDLPAALIVVIYASAYHVDAFARYLDRHSLISVKQAKAGDRLHGGTCYLAPGEAYVTVALPDGKAGLQIVPSSFPAHRGSVNILMISMADKLGGHAAGVVLSGASRDGAEGVGELYRAGGAAFVQDPNTCLVDEMPEAALEACPNARVVSDDNLARELIRMVKTSGVHRLSDEAAQQGENWKGMRIG